MTIDRGEMRERLLAPGRGMLAELRAEPSRIAEDRDHTRRARVLVAMQHDPRPSDLRLARALLAAEVEAAEDDPPRAPSLVRASVLVARGRDPHDVWLQVRAKHANFDTWCGLDGEAMFAAGVAVTLDHVRASTHADRDRVLAELEERAVHFDEAAIAEWHATRDRQWSPDPADLSLAEQIELGHAFGEPALAAALVAEYERTCGGGDQDLSLLYYEYRSLGDHEAAARVARARVERVPDATPWERVSRLRDLGTVEIRTGRADRVRAVLDLLAAPIAALERDDRYWPRIGLGHAVLELALDAWDLADPALAPVAEALVRRLMSTGAQPPPALAERLAARAIVVDPR